MQDTSAEVQDTYHNMLMAKTPEERLRMGCSMFDMAKEIVRSSIINQNPKISQRELKREIFLRFYGREFSKKRLAKMLNALG